MQRSPHSTGSIGHFEYYAPARWAPRLPLAIWRLIADHLVCKGWRSSATALAGTNSKIYTALLPSMYGHVKLRRTPRLLSFFARLEPFFLIHDNPFLTLRGYVSLQTQVERIKTQLRLIKTVEINRLAPRRQVATITAILKHIARNASSETLFPKLDRIFLGVTPTTVLDVDGRYHPGVPILTTLISASYYPSICLTHPILPVPDAISPIATFLAQIENAEGNGSGGYGLQGEKISEVNMHEMVLNRILLPAGARVTVYLRRRREMLDYQRHLAGRVAWSLARILIKSGVNSLPASLTIYLPSECDERWKENVNGMMEKLVQFWITDAEERDGRCIVGAERAIGLVVWIRGRKGGVCACGTAV